MNKFSFVAVLSAAAVVVSSCSSRPQGSSSVSGVVSNANGQKIYLDKVWMSPNPVCVDSVSVNGDGSFQLVGDVQGEPMFYNVRLANGKSFCVLLDSAQNLVVNVDANARLLSQSVSFDQSPRNENVQKVSAGASLLMEGIAARGNIDSLRRALDDYKIMVRDLIFADPQSMVGYFALMQTVGGNRVFDVTNKSDRQLFATAATSLNIAYPRSQQVKYLSDLTLAAIAQQKLKEKQDSLLKNATVVETPELVLEDLDGNIHRLSDCRGHYTILSFWLASDKDSRAANRQLAKVYKKYASRGLRIYAVSFDTSRVLWEVASKEDNVEWTNVCDLLGQQSQAALLYNVTSVPSNYIVDPEGRLVGKDLFGSRLDEKLESIFK